MRHRDTSNNFKAVLETAYEDYYNEGLSNDLAAICLGKLEESADFALIENIVHLASGLPMTLNESENFFEGVQMANAKIVQEKKGKGISVEINGKEYRYVSPTIPTDDLFHSFEGMMKHGAGGKALAYLKKHALCYYGAKNPEGADLIEGLSMNESISKPRLVKGSNGTMIYIIQNGKEYKFKPKTNDRSVTGLMRTIDSLIDNSGENAALDYLRKNFDYIYEDFDRKSMRTRS